jgi:hypothetical protein
MSPDKQIDWKDIPKSKVAELKELLSLLVALLENYDKTVETLGFETLNTLDYTSIRFSIAIADYTNLIRLGEKLEQEYLDKITRFTNQLG